MAKGEIRKKASPVNEEIVRVKGTILYSHLVTEDPEYGGFQVVLGNLSKEAVERLEADGLVLKDVNGPADPETGERVTYDNCYKFKTKGKFRLSKEGEVVDREEVKFNPSSGSEAIVAYSLWDTNYKGKAMRTAYMIGVDVTNWIEYTGSGDEGKSSAPVL